MGGKGSKEGDTELPTTGTPLKRHSTYRANEEEEQAWLDAMAQQNGSAQAYGTVRQKKVAASATALLQAKIIFVVGGPGSGKGTQCAQLSVEFNLCHLSVGDLLREEASKGSERGKILDDYMKEGKIVPMEITLEVLRAAIDERKDKAGFLIDGFPRKLDQAKEFEEKVAKCSLVLYFECSEEEMTRRLMFRGETSGRIDDNEETIKKRLHTFIETSMPVINYYQKQGKVKVVNSERDVAEVYEDSRHILAANNFPLLDIYEEDDEKKLLSRAMAIMQEKKKTQIAIGEMSGSVVYPKGSKRAVLVGLGYQMLAFKKNLGGCIKDVVQMKTVLQHCGFETLTITDQTKSPLIPTAEHILASLKHSIDGCQAGDHVVFYFSGHVGRLLDEDDGKYHEALIGFDGPVFDFEIIEILNSLPEGVNFTVLIDGCYGKGFNPVETTAFESAPRGFFFVSHCPDAKMKEMPYTAGGAMTNSLVTFLKENGYYAPLETLKESIASLLKTMNLHIFTSPLANVAGKSFLDREKTA